MNYFRSTLWVFISALTLPTCLIVKEIEHEKVTHHPYVAKRFNLDALTFLSKKQREEHYTLYTKYVTKLNEIRTQLPHAQRSPGGTYSEFRALKEAETFALNGALLHELYFENIIGKKSSLMGARFKHLILENFGSIEQYKKDLKDVAACARGWAITGYCYHDNRIYNFLLDEHNQKVPVMIVPLVVVDVYEHAYMIDYGIDRETYLKETIAHLQWDVIEKRIDALMNNPIIRCL